MQLLAAAPSERTVVKGSDESRDPAVRGLSFPLQSRPYGLLLAAGNPHQVAKATDMCGLRVGVPVVAVPSRILIRG